MGINFKNRKILISTLIFMAGIILFCYFVYFPKASEVNKLVVESKDIKRDLDELYAFIGGEKYLKDNIVKMRKDLARLEKAFPPEKEVSNIIKYINDEAKRFNVVVRSLTPSDLYTYKNTSSNEMAIGGSVCKCMPLTLKVEARYQALGEFLGVIEVVESPIIVIESIDINKDENIKPLIGAKVELMAYLLGR